MRVKVQAKLPIAGMSDSGRPRPQYPLRLSSFFASAGLHWLVIAALFTVASVPVIQSQRPVYNEFIKPNEHKIVFYDFRRKVPDVAPLKKVGSSHQPRGAELSKQAIIATSRRPKSKQVFISMPAPKTEIHEDLPAPLLIAKLDAILPTNVQAPKPKNFVPPPPSKREPKLPIQTPVIETLAPSSPAAASDEPLAPPKLVFSPVTAPPRKAPEASTASVGNAKADIAVASLHPSNAESPLPKGERPGSFSKAPTKGAAASGDTSSAKVTVPNLTVRQPKPEPEPPPSIPRRPVLYSERVSLPLSTLSVPLRPANRMIPPNVDARFHGRNVYTIVIPIEHLADYSGDWIMWFADRESKPGETPVVRAPLPFQKMEALDPAAVDRTGARIQFAATIRKNGKLDGITLLTQTNPAMMHAVLADLAAWDFQPASKDGVPVDVDVVLEIPFQLPVSLAKNPQPGEK